ncbi:MAG: sigma 54-interacting transcriptional regulator [Deltaproteobacteria bacterium]|nr:sigma 54-interacting transcriptional regulator [Deltaproteobacteria bacterium]
MNVKKSTQPFPPSSAIPKNPFPVNDILNSLPLGVLILDEAGKVVNCNQEAANLLGPAPHRLIGLPLAKIWPKTADDIVSALNGGRQAIGLVPPELDNCYIQVKPLPAGAGGATVTVFDQRLWQPFLRTSQPLDPLTPYYKEIFESSADGMAVADSKGRLVLVNEAAAGRIGVPREELQGLPVTQLTERRYASDVISHDVLATGRPVSRMIHHLKTGRHVLLTGNPIFSADGEVRLVVINQRDLTELLELQTSIQQHKLAIGHFKDALAEIQMAELAAREVVARSPSMALALETAAKLAHYDPPQILVKGEPGAGKGLIAKFIHSKSRRAEEPLIHINCRALPLHLLEAELFGYEKGAFTGAAPEGRAGLFEVAGKGTVFIDEIGEMPLPLQSKLLTFLDTRSFRRMAGRSIIRSEAAVITASGRDLRDLMERKLFRSDLYFRLSSFSIALPPLRERREDIPELARRELGRLNERYGLAMELDPEAIEALLSHPFHGNVRELMECLHQAALLSDRPQIGPFLNRLLRASRQILLAPEDPFAAPGAGAADGLTEAQLAENLHETERMILLKALATCNNTREMAEAMGISQSGVSRKLKKHGLPLPKHRSLLFQRAAGAPSAAQTPRVAAEPRAGTGKD